jgi:RNA polymerase sigma-70 factor (ECF subfamily)
MVAGGWWLADGGWRMVAGGWRWRRKGQPSWRYPRTSGAPNSRHSSTITERDRFQAEHPGSVNLKSRFPETRQTIVQALASGERDTRQRALDLIVRGYRAPVIALIARRWSLEAADAEDLAHEFFASAFEKEWLPRFNPERGRFRSFMRSCVLAFVSTEMRASQRQKRGGGSEAVPLDTVRDLLQDEGELEDHFDREWARSIIASALAALESECAASGKRMALQLFRRYDIDGSDSTTRPTYAQLAKEFGIPVTQVTNLLSWARGAFRAHVLDTLRSLSASEDEFRDDVRSLIGVSMPSGKP